MSDDYELGKLRGVVWLVFFWLFVIFTTAGIFHFVVNRI